MNEVVELRFEFQDGQKKSVRRHPIIEMMPVIFIIGGRFLVFEFVVEILKVKTLNDCQLVDYGIVFFQI